MSCARIVRVPTPYNAVELADLGHEQSSDVIYMAHWDHSPWKLERFSHTSWQFVQVTFGPTIAPPTGLTITVENPNQDSSNNGNAYFPLTRFYVVTSVNDDTGQESRQSAYVNGQNDLGLARNYNRINWSAVAGATRYKVYAAIESGAFGYIGTTVNLTFVDNNILPDETTTPPQGMNPFDGSNGYPSTVAFFEQRLFWARTRIVPNAIWGSKSSDFENMDSSLPLLADDSMSFKIVGNKANSINGLVSTTDLLALTSDSVQKISGNANEGYLRPDQIVVRKQAGRGISRLRPIVIDNVVFAQTLYGNQVRTINYEFQIDGYSTNDVTIFSPHFFTGFDILWWDYAEHPESIIWAARSDGMLLCFTWQAEQQVWGWTLCDVGGFAEAGCVINENGESRLYLSVRRTINGQTVRYLERMASVDYTNEDSCFLDAAVTVTLALGQSVVSGLEHLEGETVSALAGGNVVAGLVVSSGTIDLGFPAPFDNYAVTVGLPFTATIETMPLVVGADGTNIAKRQVARRAVLELVNSRGVLAGPDADHLFPLKPRSTEPYGAPNALLTGNYEVEMDSVVGDQTSVVIQSSDPLPLTLTGVLLEPLIAI